MFTIFYSLFILLFSIFSWGYAGNNFPFISENFLFEFIHQNLWLPGGLYCGFVIIFFIFYIIMLRRAQKGLMKSTYVWKIIIFTVIMLLFSFPAFSYDIFNYIATAKVSFFYKENPYVVMPIEIPNEPLLSFLNASNKVALYGPSWILLTYIPFKLGLNNLLLTMYSVKGLMAFFYLSLCFAIWKVSRRNLFSLALFALNPLVLIETLISSHNDVVMMFFAITSFYFLKKKRLNLSIIFFILSIFIKFATIFLLPVYMYALYMTIHKRNNISWNDVWFWSAISMFIIFFLSPIREEIYSWYLIWPLVFISLAATKPYLRLLTLGLSFGLLFRFAPFLFTRNWGGVTPLIKIIVTFAPPALIGIYYAVRKKI